VDVVVKCQLLLQGKSFPAKGKWSSGVSPYCSFSGKEVDSFVFWEADVVVKMIMSTASHSHCATHLPHFLFNKQLEVTAALQLPQLAS